MKGYQLTFYTQQDRRHGKKSMAEWLLELSREHGAFGGTLFSAGKSFGHDGRFHSAHFIELADQPVEVTIALDETICDRLLEAVKQEAVDVFFTKAPIEFGRTGGPI